MIDNCYRAVGDVPSDTSYVCSNIYKDKILAKAVCPFKVDRCGGTSPIYNFYKYGSTAINTVEILLAPGETCGYHVIASCGLPSFAPDDTIGFIVESADYLDSDMSRRMLSDEDYDFDNVIAPSIIKT